MKPDKPSISAWYLREDNRVIGPFTSIEVRRLLLRERAHVEQLVSVDQQQWQALRTVHELMPPELRTDADVVNPRSGSAKKPLPLRAMLIFVALFGGVIGFAIWWGGSIDEITPNCAASPAPAVDWRNCRLAGLNAAGADLRGLNGQNAGLSAARLGAADLTSALLDYADLRKADLAYALLPKASLRGADLRAADLTNADLSGADLRFADLRGTLLGGALLDGAKLGKALWGDGQICAEGSLGACRVEGD
jgi:hypothetical protein